MKRNNPCILILVLAFTIQLFTVSCKKEGPLETDPTRIILGKWELVQQGNTIMSDPVNYVVYKQDSLMFFYDREIEMESCSNARYWIDSLYHEGVWAPDGNYLTTEFEYKFMNNNNIMELRLLHFFGTYNYFVYKRINESK